MAQNGLDEITQASLVAQIMTVATQVHPCEYGFLIARGRERLNFCYYIPKMTAYPFPTGYRGHTKSTFVVTPILYLDESTSVSQTASHKFAHKRFLLKEWQVEAGLGV